MSVATELDSFPSRRATAFRAVEAILREDQALRSVVKNWSSWSGDAIDRAPATAAMMPMIRLAPIPMANRVASQHHMRIDLAINVEVMVPGTRADHLLNAWELVEAAMVDTKPFRQGTVGCYLQQAVGAMRADVAYPAIGAFSDRTPAHFLGAKGQIVLTFLAQR